MEDNSNVVITEDMNHVLRCQRHDFINYIQVIRAYLQVGKPEQALDYVNGLTQKVNDGTFCADYFVGQSVAKHD